VSTLALAFLILKSLIRNDYKNSKHILVVFMGQFSVSRLKFLNFFRQQSKPKSWKLVDSQFFNNYKILPQVIEKKFKILIKQEII
jgi:hypothetical protein